MRLPLKNYSIGHEILLLQSQNPFVTLTLEEFAKLKTEDQCFAVITAVLICCRDWTGNQKPHRNMKLWGWFIRKENFPLAIADFRNYRAAGSLFPRITELDDKEAGRELGSSYLARLLNFITATQKVEQPLDFPYGMATFLFFAALESEDRIKVENSIEQQTREEIAKIQKEIKAEQKKEEKCPTP